MNTSMPTNSESVESTDGEESGSDLRDPHSALGVEEVVNEEEARRRREQLNRRPSYRMILKDLETVGDKQMKKEMLDDGNAPNTYNHDRTGAEHSTNNTTGSALHQLGSPGDSPNFTSNSSSSSSSSNPNNNVGIGGGPKAVNVLPPGLRVGVVGTAAAHNQQQQQQLTQQQQQQQHISPPTQQNLAALGQLNLLGTPAAATAAPHNQQQPQHGRLLGGGGTAEGMPSQPQPQQLLLSCVGAAAVNNNNSALAGGPPPPPQPLLTAVNNLEMLGLKAPADALGQAAAAAAAAASVAAFGPNDWQNNLLSSAYGRAPPHHPQQQQQASLMQHNNNNIGTVPSPLGMNSSGMPVSHAAAVQHQQQQHVTPPPHGLGSRQGSASLTSFSPNVRSENDDNNRKRQVRLLKNREAAKECRRKKKEYVKCLENRVAVLENQNKALIEELKTLKELYCRKEKGDLQ